MRALVARAGGLALMLAGCGPGTPSDGDDEVASSDSTSASETSTSTSSSSTSTSSNTSETETSTASESSDTGEPICDEVHGDLVVDANTPLESLACVREVGSLTLENSTLTDLSAFPALEDVDYLWIHDNPNLVSLAGADALVHVGQLWLSRQAQLSSLAGLAPDDLWEIVLGEGLDGLTSLDLAANVKVYRLHLWGWDRPDAQPVADLQPTVVANYYFEVSLTDTANLVDLSAIATCCGGANLSLRAYDPGQIDFHGLESQIEMGRLILEGSSIESFAGLDNLERLDGLWLIEHCPSHQNTLTNLSGLSKLVEVGEVRIEHNTELLTLAGLDSLAFVDSLYVYENNLLAELALPAGLAVATSAKIFDNDALPIAEVDAFLASIDAGDEQACGNGSVGDCVFTKPCPQ